MDGWFGGLVYVYNADAIEVLNTYVYRLDVLESVSAVAVGAPFYRRRIVLRHQQPLQMLRQRDHQLVRCLR